jgi:Na+/phosphate symporter
MRSLVRDKEAWTMKHKEVFFNPFRMLSPRLDAEAVRIEELYEKPVSESVSLEEGLLIMISKLIEMTRELSKCVLTEATHQMDRCEELASEVHEQEKILTRGLVSSDVEQDLLKGIIRFPFRLERIGDMLESILKCCRIKAEKRVPFSDKAYAELEQLFSVLLDMMINMRDALRTPNKVLLETILAEGKHLSGLLDEFKMAHWERLEAGFCAPEASSVYRDILDSIKWSNEYLERMCATLLELGDRSSG